jgi:hypothetical protein
VVVAAVMQEAAVVELGVLEQARQQRLLLVPLIQLLLVLAVLVEPLLMA